MHAPPDPQVLTRRHREMLVVTCLVVLLPFLLQVRRDDRVAPVGLDDYPLPHTCMTYAWFGVKCPGCGLTRSFIHLAHGDWTSAFKAHRIGWILALALVLQLPYRIAALARADRSLLGSMLPRIFGYVLIGLLLTNWLFDVVYG